MSVNPARFHVQALTARVRELAEEILAEGNVLAGGEGVTCGEWLELARMASYLDACAKTMPQANNCHRGYWLQIAESRSPEMWTNPEGEVCDGRR